MSLPVDRRTFLQSSAALAAAVAVGGAVKAEEPKNKRGLKKALKLSMIPDQKLTLVEKFKLAKQCGFEGIDVDREHPQEEVLKARDESGLTIHGVVDYVHWNQPLSSPDAAVRANGVKKLEQCLRDAKAFGGTTVLLVVGVVNKETSYVDAYLRTQAEIRKVLPLAQELQIKIAFENVWNMFLLSPLEMARYIDEFESSWVGAYFDVGNVVNYGWPEHWIRTLGKRILKLDIKEYSRKLRDRQGPGAGFKAELGEGDCDWPAVLKALDEVGYSGWCTAEVGGGGLERLTDVSKRMDKILELV